MNIELKYEKETELKMKYIDGIVSYCGGDLIKDNSKYFIQTTDVFEFIRNFGSQQTKRLFEFNNIKPEDIVLTFTWPSECNFEKVEITL